MSNEEEKVFEREKGPGVQDVVVRTGTVHTMMIFGNIDSILDSMTSGRGKKKIVIKRVLDILVGLSLKGYEGKTVGTIFLIGDMEGIRRNTRSMIINPFKGWKNVNILEERWRLTFESFCQLDGALVLDHRGYAHYAGRMILVREDRGSRCEDRRIDPEKKGRGTRWRASRFITERTKTVAISLSSRGDISIFERGKEIGRLERKLCTLDPEKAGVVVDAVFEG